MAESIILKQRLRTRGLVAILMLVAVVIVNVAVVLPSASASVPLVGTIVGYGVVLLLLVIIAMFALVEVVVTERSDGPALEVRYGPRGIIRQVFVHSRISAAQAKSMGFMEMGGWGYRGSLKVLGRAALATRRGDALVLQIDQKKVFIVTVDNPVSFVTALGF